MTTPRHEKPEPLSEAQLKWLRTADESGVVDWNRPKFFTYPAWKAMMERLERRGFVTERAGGGYNLTPLGIRSIAPKPPPPPPAPAPTVEPTPEPKPVTDEQLTKMLKPRKLTPGRINKLVADLPKRMAAMEADDEDRRCLRGKHAPPTGTCWVCGGTVVAEIRFPNSGVMGGPAPRGYIHRYYCQICSIVYRDLPKEPSP